MLIAKYLTKDLDIKAEIEAFEKKNHVSLPEQYKRFLEKYNGGDTPKTDYKRRRRVETVRYFYGLGDAIDNLNEIYYLDEWLEEKKLLPIAEDFWGNYYAIGISDVNKGKVYFCDHERGYRRCRLTDDLKTFFDCCISGEIDPMAYMPVEEREADLIARGYGDNITDWLREEWQREIDKYKNMVREEVVLD